MICHPQGQDPSGLADSLATRYGGFRLTCTEHVLSKAGAYYNCSVCVGGFSNAKNSLTYFEGWEEFSVAYIIPSFSEIAPFTLSESDKH